MVPAPPLMPTEVPTRGDMVKEPVPDTLPAAPFNVKVFALASRVNPKLLAPAERVLNERLVPENMVAAPRFTVPV